MGAGVVSETPWETDRATNAESAKKWWSKLVWAETLPLILLFAPLPMLLSGVDNLADAWSRLSGLGRSLAGLFRWELEPVAASEAVSGWVVLGVFATAGIAATVALNGALERVERMHSMFRAEPQSSLDVLSVRQAEIGQGAALLVGLVALFLSHVVLVSAVVSVVIGEPRGPAAVGASMAAFISLFFLIECTRLAAPSTEPLKVARDRSSQERLNRLERAARLASRGPGITGAVIAGTWNAAVLIALLWWVCFVFMVESDAATFNAPALLMSVLLVFLLIALCGEGLAGTATFEKGVTRISTLVMSVSMVVAGWAVCASALISGWTEPGAWGGRWWPLVVSLLMVMAVGAAEVLRVLGCAQVGPLRHLGLRGLWLAGEPIRRFRSRWIFASCTAVVLLILAGLAVLAARGAFDRVWIYLVAGAVAVWGGLRPNVSHRRGVRLVIAAVILAVTAVRLRLGLVEIAVLPWTVFCLLLLSVRLWRKLPLAPAFADHVHSFEIARGRRMIASSLSDPEADDPWDEQRAAQWANQLRGMSMRPQ